MSDIEFDESQYLYCLKCCTWFNESSMDEAKIHKEHSAITEEIVAKQENIKSLVRGCQRQTELANPFDSIKQTQRENTKDGKAAPPVKPNDVADALMNLQSFARITGTRDKDLLKQENRVYIKGGFEFVKKQIAWHLPEESAAFRLEVVKFIADYNNAAREDFDKDKLILNCKNCFVNIETDRKYDDHEDLMSLVQIDTNYKPELGESKLFLKTIKESSPDYWEFILEHAACGLSRGHIKPERCLVLTGDGQNGKSTILLVLEKLFGKDNVGNIKMQKIQEDRFAAARLENKMVNLFPDLSEQTMEHMDVLKAIVTHDRIDVEHKGIDGWSATITAMMIFSCNELPNLPNYADSTLRRFTVLPFRQNFKQNEALKEELTTEDEKSRILNTLISYHKKLVQNGRKLIHTQTNKEVEDLWRNNSDSATQFIIKHILPLNLLEEVKGKDMVPKPTATMVYDDYIRFCHLDGQTPLTPTGFNKKMTIDGYKTYVTRENKESIRKWENCILKRIEDRVLDTSQNTL